MIWKAGIILGVMFLFAVGYGYMDWNMLGFPDGYLTDFERETSSFRFGVVLVNAALGILAMACGIGWLKPSRIIAGVLVLAFFVITLPSVLLPSCANLPGCPSVYETVTGHTFNDGGGG